ncbi:hypothetical protein [Desulfosporosinus sp. SB140]|uniref:hypothetical protein n=1 Tax=Desulfosporosinus paludis TaxID=3115649 RepID=UPI00388EC3AE
MIKTDIRLQSLKLQNIKGFEDYSLVLDGKNADIFGRNATGKTSLYDLFLWVLFGKDSFNRADYQIKPQDEDGNEVHHLESIAEIVLITNGKPIKLKRQLSEKWVHKRGTHTEEFTGNETSYWVNDVPVKTKDYAAEINTLIKENIFKLLTNPLFFNTNDKGWGWQERRKILFEICGGNVTDAEIIDSLITPTDKSMADLLNVINSGRTIDQHKLVIAEKIKETKKQLDGIPARISEQKRNVPAEVTDYTAIEALLSGQKALLEGIESELATNTQSSNLYRQKQQQAFGIQTKIDARRKEIDSESGSGLKKLIDEKSRLESEKYQLETDAKALERRQLSGKLQEQNLENSIVDLRKKYKDEFKKEFIPPSDGSFNCPTCGQALPEENKETQLAELKKKFTDNKNKLLKQIQAEGVSLNESLQKLKSDNESLENSIKDNDAGLLTINDRLAELEKEISKEQELQSEPNYDSDPKYSSLGAELKALQEELNKPIEDTATEIIARKREVSEQIESLNRTLNEKEAIEKAKTRIDDLKAEESKLASELSEHERHDYLIKKFTTAKVKTLEDSINSRFKAVKFKMFDTLTDGTEKEICKILVNTNGVWVEFDGANNGGKINAGLDIINLLSEFYGVSCPIFVDNAESVTGFTEVKSQVIKLIVSEQDSKLRVEVEN